MKDRIKEIRKNSPYGKNQATFSEFLGIPQSNLASYEIGRRQPSDAVIQLICQKCGINKDWLLTGNGEPTIKRTRNQEIASFMNDVMELPDKAFKKRFIEALSELKESQWEVLAEIVENLRESE